MATLLLNNEMHKIVILLLSISFLSSCKYEDSKVPESKIDMIEIPAEQFSIPVIDSLDFTHAEMPTTDFEAIFKDYIGYPIGSFLRVKTIFDQKRILYSNCNRITYYPSILFYDELVDKYNYQIKENNIVYVMKNLIGSRRDGTKIKAFYLAWVNQPITFYDDRLEELMKGFISEDIDSTTLEIITSLDTNLIRNVYKNYKGRIRKVKIDSIFFPLHLRNSLDYYAEIVLDSIYNGKPIFGCHRYGRISILPEEERDSVLRLRAKHNSRLK